LNLLSFLVVTFRALSVLIKTSGLYLNFVCYQNKPIFSSVLREAKILFIQLSFLKLATLAKLGGNVFNS
jgi:uncharacterized membrane protein YobD (UPF0266 family)